MNNFVLFVLRLNVPVNIFSHIGTERDMNEALKVFTFDEVSLVY